MNAQTQRYCIAEVMDGVEDENLSAENQSERLCCYIDKEQAGGR